MTTSLAEQGDALASQKFNRAAFASLIGTTIEWYDFYLFVFCSALVFSKVFFAATDPVSVYLGLQSGLLFGSYCLIVYGAN